MESRPRRSYAVRAAPCCAELLERRFVGSVGSERGNVAKRGPVAHSLSHTMVIRRRRPRGSRKGRQRSIEHCIASAGARLLHSDTRPPPATTSLQLAHPARRQLALHALPARTCSHFHYHPADPAPLRAPPSPCSSSRMRS
jgi:hypothetical protein